MNNIKQPSVAGTFYSSNKNELLKQIEYFKQVSANDYEYKSRAVIVPHAGLIYSGRLAYDGLKSLKGDLKTLIIFAPSHHARFDNLVFISKFLYSLPKADISSEFTAGYSILASSFSSGSLNVCAIFSLP